MCGGDRCPVGQPAAARHPPEAAVAHLRGVRPGILDSRDAEEGLASFVERRDARFEGR